MERATERVIQFDLARMTVRELNQFLHQQLPSEPNNGEIPHLAILNPNGQHNIAVGVTVPARIEIQGNAGYFVGGMNQQADIVVHGHAGWSVAENIMSGSVRIKGSASECVAASGQGGLVVIEGDASSRCGISMKGCDIVVGGDVGHMSAFMAQAGALVICGDAGPSLGDSLYEAVIYVRGAIHGLGTDAQEEPLTAHDLDHLGKLLKRAGFDYSPQEFKRVASARTLYHWHVDAGSKY